MTRLEEILLEYPSAPWDWNSVSCNPSISFQYILNHPELPWNPRYVSRNKSITELDVRDHPYFNWDREILCENPNISLQFMNDYIIKPNEVKRINWQQISANPSVTMQDVLNYPSYGWDHQYLSLNPNINSNFILNEGRSFNWDASFVSANPGITAKDIFKNSLKSLFEWNYKTLSTNQNLPIVYVKDNLTREWNYHEISRTADLVDIEQFSQIRWDPHGLSMNRNMKNEYIMNHPSIPWHLPSIVANPSISIDYDWIRKHWKDSKSIESYMSSNPTITNDWIKKNKSNVDWKRLSSNVLIDDM